MKEEILYNLLSQSGRAFGSLSCFDVHQRTIYTSDRPLFAGFVAN